MKRRMLAVTWAVTIVVCAVMVVLVVLREAQWNAACTSQGWSQAPGRGGYCTDGDGVVRRP